jgi:hypothetical protein
LRGTEIVRIQTVDIGCEPSPSVPAETLLADGWKTYLLFWAVSKDVGESGRLDDLGVAVLDCQGCVACKFGYPNDEGMPEHPFYNSGMADLPSSVLEVLDSIWTHEVTEQMHASVSRIWGGRGMDSSWSRDWVLRHFILTLKEKTFECLASTLAVERYFPTFDEAIAFVVAKFKEH